MQKEPGRLPETEPAHVAECQVRPRAQQCRQVPGYLPQILHTVENPKIRNRAVKGSPVFQVPEFFQRQQLTRHSLAQVFRFHPPPSHANHLR